VREFAGRHLAREFGNPSALHSIGVAAKAAVEDARARVAELINAEGPETIVFTGGLTEANNLAIRGTVTKNANKGKRVLASAIEHISVQNPMKYLQKTGFDLALVRGLHGDRGSLRWRDDLQRHYPDIGYVRQRRDGTIDPAGEILISSTRKACTCTMRQQQGANPNRCAKDGIDLSPFPQRYLRTAGCSRTLC
jgi:cysteine desulfurase